MTQRFEAFKAEYEALCKKHRVHIAAWYDCSLAVYDIYPDEEWEETYLDLADRTEET